MGNRTGMYIMITKTATIDVPDGMTREQAFEYAFNREGDVEFDLDVVIKDEGGVAVCSDEDFNHIVDISNNK